MVTKIWKLTASTQQWNFLRQYVRFRPPLDTIRHLFLHRSKYLQPYFELLYFAFSTDCRTFSVIFCSASVNLVSASWFLSGRLCAILRSRPPMYQYRTKRPSLRICAVAFVA